MLWIDIWSKTSPFFGFMVILNLCTISDIIHKSGALLLWISVLFLVQCKMSEYSECDACTRRLRIAEFISISESTCTSVRIIELNSLHIYICCKYIKGYDEFVMGNLLNYSLCKTSLRVYNALSRQPCGRRVQCDNFFPRCMLKIVSNDFQIMR